MSSRKLQAPLETKFNLTETEQTYVSLDIAIFVSHFTWWYKWNIIKRVSFCMINTLILEMDTADVSRAIKQNIFKYLLPPAFMYVL